MTKHYELLWRLAACMAGIEVRVFACSAMQYTSCCDKRVCIRFYIINNRTETGRRAKESLLLLFHVQAGQFI